MDISTMVCSRHTETGFAVSKSYGYLYVLANNRQQNAVASLSGHRVTNDLYYIVSVFPRQQYTHLECNR